MRSLRTQLTLAIVLAVFLTVALISILSNTLINKQFETYMLEHQKEKITGMVATLAAQYNSETGAWDATSVYTLGMYYLNDGYIIKLSDKNGGTVWDAEHHDMTLCSQIMGDIARRMEAYGNSGEFVSAELPLIQNGQSVGSVSLRYMGPYFLSENDFSFLGALNLILVCIGLFSLLFALGAGWLLARRISRPVTKTADIARSIAAGNYSVRFEGKTKTKELHDLVSSVNNLADALARQENLRRQLTADVAHELRTPLTTLGAHLEAMLEGVWEPTARRLKSCHEEILRLCKMVADLELLEHAESAHYKLDKTPVDLLALAGSVCGNFAGACHNKNLRLTIHGDRSEICVDKDRISGVITNILSNAVKYTPDGGNIRITVEDSADTSVLYIEDEGIGIPESELPFIFERLYRADKSRNRNTGGAGIGLAIVKSVILAHNGTVTAQSAPDKGSRFTITLPKR
jgi:signal transduction histidine kinase